jgi:hypothetical protein
MAFVTGARPPGHQAGGPDANKEKEIFMPGPQVGEAAPDFTLPRSLDAVLTLSECLAYGPVLLHFYVFDFGTI